MFFHLPPTPFACRIKKPPRHSLEAQFLEEVDLSTIMDHPYVAETFHFDPITGKEYVYIPSLGFAIAAEDITHVQL